jgi:hypothetical protein
MLERMLSSEPKPRVLVAESAGRGRALLVVSIWASGSRYNLKFPLMRVAAQ